MDDMDFCLKLYIFVAFSPFVNAKTVFWGHETQIRMPRPKFTHVTFSAERPYMSMSSTRTMTDYQAADLTVFINTKCKFAVT